jgi:hypothetical protein
MAFGILLFVVVYGRVACVVYAELRGRRSRVRTSRLRTVATRRPRLQRRRWQLELVR